MEKSLESIIGGGILGLESDDIIPQEEVTSDDLNETILDAKDEVVTVEHFLMFEKNFTSHVNCLKSIENGKYLTSTEDGTLKKIGTAIYEALKRLYENMINFFIKVINHLRSIGIKNKCSEISKNKSALLAAVNVWKNDSEKNPYKGVKKLDPVGINVAVKELKDFDNPDNGSVILSSEAAEENYKKFEKLLTRYLDAIKNDKDRQQDALEVISTYLELDIQKQEEFFTGGFERQLREYKNLIKETEKRIKELSSTLGVEYTDGGAKYMLKTIHLFYSTLIRVTPEWITLTNFVYGATKKIGTK